MRLEERDEDSRSCATGKVADVMHVMAAVFAVLTIHIQTDFKVGRLASEIYNLTSELRHGFNGCSPRFYDGIRR